MKGKNKAWKGQKDPRWRPKPRQVLLPKPRMTPHVLKKNSHDFFFVIYKL